MSVRIRDYASGDLESVVRLVGSVLAEYGFTPQTGGVERDLAEAAKAHRLYERNGFALVESRDNEWEDDVFEKSIASNA